MSSFRILNQAPQYLLADGSVNAGGKLFFFETDLTTPKDTWSNPTMTVLNSNPVVMDASGRTLTDVWGDGEYGVKMTDSADVVIWTRNNVKQGGDAGATIPVLQDGEFLTNDGSNLLWQPILQVPDPTGHSGQVLFSDGSLSFWAALPVTPDPPDPDIVVTSTTFQAGISSDNTKYFVQKGTGSAPASFSRETSVGVTFPVPFDDLWIVNLSMDGTGFTSLNDIPRFSFVSKSATAFNVRFVTGENSTFSGWDITSPVTFTWIAHGTKEVAP